MNELFWPYALVFMAFALIWLGGCFLLAKLLARVIELTQRLTEQLLALKNPWVANQYQGLVGQRGPTPRPGVEDEQEYEDDMLG